MLPLSGQLRRRVRHVLEQLLPAKRRMKKAACRVVPRLEALEDRLAPATLHVNTAADGTQSGTLRWAITEANNNPHDSDLIVFDGAYTINLTAGQLPDLETAITIDGTVDGSKVILEPGITPRVEVRGNGAVDIGLVMGSGTTVRGLIMNGFNDAAITVVGSGSGAVQASNILIERNYLGTNKAGSTQDGIEGSGIDVLDKSLVTSIIRYNLISGHTNYGIRLVGFGNDINNNRIGTDLTAAGRIHNFIGLYLDNADSNVIDRNVLSGNQVGLSIDRGVDNIITRNYIGTNSGGTADLGNDLHGIRINYGSDNVIGGSQSNANVIAFNGAGSNIKGNGVTIDLGVRNTILSNQFYKNANRGIALYDDLGQSWDKDDADAGPNTFLNAPYVEEVTADTMVWWVQGKPFETYRIQVFSSTEDDRGGSARQLQLDLPAVTADLNGRAKFETQVSAFWTATATDIHGNTSELGYSDVDGDGIYDPWENENHGIDWDLDGIYDLKLHDMGAQVYHKDLFVEADAMANFGVAPLTPAEVQLLRDNQGYNPELIPSGDRTGTALDAVIYAFADSPVANPDGAKGVRLHITYDPTLPHLATLDWDQFKQIKDANIGTPEERKQWNWNAIKESRKLVYRYTVFCDQAVSPDYGLSEIGNTYTFLGQGSGRIVPSPAFLGGNDIMILVGKMRADKFYTSITVAGCFMHELGHTLGLGHGGQDDINEKPNYHSIMNYAWVLMNPEAGIADGRISDRYHLLQSSYRLDYSGQVLNTLNEGMVNEELGMGGDPTKYAQAWVHSPGSGILLNRVIVPQGGWADFNGDSVHDSSYGLFLSEKDLQLHSSLLGLYNTQFFVLHGSNDWENLVYNFRHSSDFKDEAHLEAADDDGDFHVDPADVVAPPGSADLVVSQIAIPAATTIGTNVTYTLTVTNNGPDAAADAKVINTLPGNVTVVSVTPSVGTFVESTGGVYFFDLGDLASGTQVTITFTVTPQKPGTFTNQARVLTQNTDTNEANNSSSRSVTITQNLVISTPPPAANIQEHGTYTGSFAFTDPSGGSWTATIDYGDGSPVATFGATPSTSIPLSHMYAGSGVYTVRVSVTNATSGQVAEAAALVNVANLTPTLTLSDPSAPAVIHAADEHFFRLSTTDFGPRFVYRVHWGDGGDVEEFVSDALCLAGHTYAAAGTYTIRATVVDKDGAESAERTLAITVAPPVSYYPTAIEQEFLERLNDARANPAAYGATLGLNLSTYPPVMPEAFDIGLMEAARKHSQYLSDTGIPLTHFSANGEGPSDRAAAAGFVGLVFESIGMGYPQASPVPILDDFVIDFMVPNHGHRDQLLATQHRQIGAGFVGMYATIDSGLNLNETQPFLTGAVFNDLNNSGRYDVGEGVEGATVTVQGVGSTTTWASGGYNYRLDPGTYTVTISGAGIVTPVTRTITFTYSSSWGLWENQRLSVPVVVLPPNDVVGPAGAGANHSVKSGDVLDYRIRFGNTQTGNPVQQLQIRQTLDADLDPATFVAGAIRIGAQTVTVQPGQTLRVFLVDVGVNVDVSLTVNGAGNVVWNFQTVNPTSASMGFLPYRFGGEVSYQVQSRANRADGTLITAAATMDFRPQGVLRTVTTATITNRIDALAPTSSVGALPAQSLPTFTVSWSGQDNSGGSGLAAYDVYVSQDGTNFVRWQRATTQTSAAFTGAVGRTYYFYSVATDNVGLRQAAPAAAQQQTTVFQPPTVLAVSSTAAAGVYDAGDVIAIQVLFSENVTVTGTPQLLLETGINDALATYSGGSGTNTLTFTYQVAGGQRSRDLDYASAAALSLNGGTIRNALGVNAQVALPAPAAAGSLAANEALVIDTTVATVGIFDPNSAVWYLRNSNTPGGPNVTPFAYGFGGTIPVVGDWDGDGDKTIGLYYPATGQWFLRNSTGPGAPDIPVFAYGFPGTIPVVGDWDGDGRDSVGLYYPATGQWFLRNSNGPGAPDIPVFAYGFGGTLPVVGDWDGDGDTNIGLYYPATAQWFLRDVNGPGAPTTPAFAYGFGGTIPVAGDWNSDGRDSIGLYYPGTARWFLRNNNGPGAPDVPVFAFGFGTRPIVGDWNFPAAPLRAEGLGAGANALTQSDLDQAVVDALTRLQLAGADVAILTRLGSVHFAVGWLDDAYLGLAFADEGRVLIDADAAGHGWFIDPTPLDDTEFAYPAGPTTGRMDLLSAVLHELGHSAGLDHGTDCMTETLAPDSRHLDALDLFFAGR